MCKHDPISFFILLNSFNVVEFQQQKFQGNVGKTTQI